MAIAASLSLLSGTAAHGEKAQQLTTLNGLEAGGAESALASRGFKYIDGTSNSMGYTYSNWWKSADRTCVTVEAHRGRVKSIVDAPAQDCGHTDKGSGNAAAAVGVVAGAAILGALLSHKSSHHDDGNQLSDQAAESQYERGYTDGLHNASYHNYDKSDAYSSGYTAGVDEREANLNHHMRRGGYAPAAAFADLQGARAAGAMDELTRRGFVQVDNFVSGTARYSIQWRAASKQRLQVIIVDGHIEDIRDIETNPGCR